MTSAPNSRRCQRSQDVAGAWRRPRIVLAAAEGLENNEIAVRLEASADTARQVRVAASCGGGLDGLYDEPRRRAASKSAMTPSRKRVRSCPDAAEETRPETRPSLEPSLDTSAGERPRALDHSSIWRAFGLHLHRSETFKLVERSLLRGRSMPTSSVRPNGSCPGSLCRLKRARSRPWTVPSPSCRCRAPRAGGAAQPRLQAPRHDLSLRGGSTSPREMIIGMFPAPSGAESSANSSTSSKWVERPCGSRHPHRHGAHDGPTRPFEAIRDWFAKRPSLAGPFHTHQRLLAEPGLLVRAADRQADQGAASIAPPRS